MASVSPRCQAISQFLSSRGEPPWRLKQVLHGIYKDPKWKWHAIEGLPSGLRWKLKDHFGKYISTFKPGAKYDGDFTQTVLLHARKDDAQVEAVSLQFRSRRSLCISSQVGCAFQRGFEATESMGLKRQLDADEICDQVLYFMQRDQRIDSVSLMGMGEPLANPRVFDALQIMTCPDLLGMSSRRINISTVGVIPGILKLTEDFPQINLNLLLHSPFTEEWNRLAPLNRMYPMRDVLDVLDQRIKRTGRRVWVSYLLLRGQNDTLEHAKALVQLLKERPAEVRYLYHVNLLPSVSGESDARTRAPEVDAFQAALQDGHVSCSYRAGPLY